MKKHLFYASALMLTLSLASCSNEEETLSMQGDRITVQAGFGSKARSAVQVDSKGVVWSEGEQIYLFGEGAHATLDMIGGAGETKATFGGVVYGPIQNITKALYPVPNVEDETYTYEFPSERDWTAESNSPMIGNLEDGNIAFENMAALVRVILPIPELGDQANIVTLTMDGIAGNATVDTENGTLDFEASGDEVTVNVPAGEYIIDLPIPAGTYTSYSVKLNDKVLKEGTSNGLTLEADDALILNTNYDEANDTYTLYSPEELFWVAIQVNNGSNNFAGKTVKLGADIDLDNFPWIGIGDNDEKYFEGIFDGNGKTISNLYNEIERGCIGLFSQVQGKKNSPAKLMNLILKNVKFAGKNYVGALLGYCGNYVTIENISLTGDVEIEGRMNVGGLVGGTCKTISDITVNVNEGSFVKSSFGPVGGVAGLLVENYHASNIQSNIDVFASFKSEQWNGNNGAGGIFGCTNGYGSTVTNCASSGDVTIESENTDVLVKRIGGISGRVHGKKITFDGCSYTGTLKSTYEGSEITDFPYNGLVGESGSTAQITIK